MKSSTELGAAYDRAMAQFTLGRALKHAGAPEPALTPLATTVTRPVPGSDTSGVSSHNPARDGSPSDATVRRVPLLAAGGGGLSAFATASVKTTGSATASEMAGTVSDRVPVSGAGAVTCSSRDRSAG